MKIHKLKAGEKATRITALVLTAALIFTSIDLAVFAAANEGIKRQEVITGFGELDESVAVQLLPVGAQEIRFHFPVHRPAKAALRPIHPELQSP